MRLRGAGGPPFAAGRVLAVPARTAALRADRRPPRARPGRRRAVVRARCRRVGSDRRGRRARCRRLPIDRGNTPQRDTVKFCTPVGPLTAVRRDTLRTCTSRTCSRTALTLRGIPIDPISRHATTRRQIGNYPVHLQCRAHPHILAVPASKIQRYEALSFLLSSHTVHPRAKSS